MAYDKTEKLHIVAAVAVIRNGEGKCLVLKRAEREIAYPGMYTFPGGKLERNQTTWEALQEEVMEEAGLVLAPGKILLKDKAFIRPDGQTVKVFSYLCWVKDYSRVRISQDFTDYKWIALRDVDTIPHVGIRGELEQAEKLFRLHVPFQDLFTESVKEV